MPITILDYVKSVVGDKDLYTAEDCLASGVDILGGCQGCHATIACLQRLPLHLRVLALRRLHRHRRLRHRRRLHRPEAAPAACPACGTTDNLSEIRITTGERAEGYALECGDCGEVWPQ